MLTVDKKRHWLYSLEELKIIRDNFVRELSQAASGKMTSFSFFKNPLPCQLPTGKREIFQVMVIGGRSFKTTKIKSNLEISCHDRCILSQSVFPLVKILKAKEKPLPIFKTSRDFFEFFEKHLEPNVKIVALNFAFPLVPSLRGRVLDGFLIKSTKEHQFCGLIGKKIGQELEKYILKKRGEKIKVAVANDTICLLLAGLTFSHQAYSGTILTTTGKRWFQIVAGVVGTGTNFAFFLDKNTAVNLESGNFDKFPQTETGKIIDQNSASPGQQLFEKEVAGAYLFEHYNLIIDKFYLSTDRIKDRIGKKKITSTYQLNEIAQNPKHPFTQLAKKLFERSASLIACQIAGIYLFKKSNFDFRISNFEFLMEGSLFWQGFNYQNYVKKYLKLLGIADNTISFIKIPESSIIGAANLIQ